MIHSVTPQQAKELIARGNLEVIDVRDDREWSSGHIPGARLLPLERLRSSPAAMLPKDGVLFVCAAGARSQTAARVAESRGITHVYNLNGGTRGWAHAGLPLVRD